MSEGRLRAIMIVMKPFDSAPAPSLVLRSATYADAPAVRRLAALDDAPMLADPIMIALEDGEPVAALSLADQRVVANPFRLTQDSVALLRLRAQHLVAPASSPRRARRSVAHLRIA
jgi:hypothetical protein